MAISKKDAKIAIRILGAYIPKHELQNCIYSLRAKGAIKNKSFRKSLKRIAKMLEPPKKAAVKKAA